MDNLYNSSGCFKVGDHVRGNSPYRYGITNSKMTDGLITDVRGKHLTVKVLKHTGGYQSDVLFGGLEAKYFDLILPDAENKQETV